MMLIYMGKKRARNDVIGGVVDEANAHPIVGRIAPGAGVENIEKRTAPKTSSITLLKDKPIVGPKHWKRRRMAEA
jgi:hypothetical protein